MYQRRKPQERRRYVRVDINSAISVKRAGKVTTLEAVGKDISLVGIRFSSQEKLRLGEVVEVELKSSPRSPSFVLRGQVVWSALVPGAGEKRKPVYDAGVKLLNLNKADEAKFLALVYDRMIDTYRHYVKI
jgi:c-di-GMP-binding flagellar brake protein YcgR